MPNKARNPKPENRSPRATLRSESTRLRLARSEFVIRASGLIRHSGFVIRISNGLLLSWSLGLGQCLLFFLRTARVRVCAANAS